MIKGNVIYFGYGDILVGHTPLMELTLKFVKPPFEVGKTITKEDKYEILQEIKLDIDFGYPVLVRKAMRKEIEEFKIGDYILNFSNFNILSLNVLEEHMEKALGQYIMCLAC